MRSTLVGVIRVDPAKLLEDGLLKELERHISKKFEEFIEPQGKKLPLSASNLLSRLQKLSESMDGYKRSLEYIQDYINIHGLRIWQIQVGIINPRKSKFLNSLFRFPCTKRITCFILFRLGISYYKR